jgi:hypothetical protein
MVKSFNLACYSSFCYVCCDHLKQELSFIANFEIIGELLQLRNQAGEVEIEKFSSSNDIARCKQACKKHYKYDMPINLPPPARDNDLGTTSENAAKSCSDIKKWGA